MFRRLIELGYEIRFLSHAKAILSQDFPEVEAELESSLIDFHIPITEIIGSGGGEAAGTQRLRHSLSAKSWKKTEFVIGKTINGVVRESISHEVDHVKFFEETEESPAAAVALEIEWNNKDPFFDRDLENYKRLHAEGAISVGIIITRGPSLQKNMEALVLRFTEERKVKNFADLKRLGLELTSKQIAAVTKRFEREAKPVPFHKAWANNFVKNKFGASTTHWKKLIDRVDRGVGNPCPLVLIGLPDTIVTFDPDALIEDTSVEASSADV